jgi:hypothetical protein
LFKWNSDEVAKRSSLDDSVLKLAGSMNKNEDLNSVKRGFEGVAHKFLGRCVIENLFSNKSLYKYSLRLKMSINDETDA